MGICWYCYWGWPEPIADIYDEAVKRLNGDSHSLHFGPAHIVWDDENFHQAQWCLDHLEEYRMGLTDAELEIVKWSLEELLKVPQDMCNEPMGYVDDQDHPEKYRPPNDWVMVWR